MYPITLAIKSAGKGIGVNNLYTFSVVGRPRVFVAAPTWKEARNIAYRDCFKSIVTLPEIEGFIVNPRCTDRNGVIPVADVCAEFAWWRCRCGNQRFVALDAGDTCRCTQCGKEIRILTRKG